MNKLNAIIIITSRYINRDRFYGGKSEWEAWGFEKDQLIAYVADGRVEFTDQAQQIPPVTTDRKIICWINMWKIRHQLPLENLTSLISNIFDSLKIDKGFPRIAYHDEFDLELIPPSLKEITHAYSHAVGNLRQFNLIWQDEKLNPLAGFDKIAECFFLNRPKLSSIIKHRIAHLFLSMDMDFQGIEAVKGNSAKTLEYLKAVLGSHEKKSEYYQAKIKKLQEYVKAEEQSIWQALQGILPETDPDRELLLALCGITEGHVKSFVEKLDKMSGNNLGEQDVKTVKQPFGEAGWELHGAEPPRIKSFHDWFCALINVLERLQEKIPTEQQLEGKKG